MARQREFSDYELIQWTAFFFVRQMEKQAVKITPKAALQVVCGFFILAAVPTFAWMAYAHPFAALYVVISMIVLWTLLVSYGTFRLLRHYTRKHRKTRMARYRISLRKCLFEGKCVNKRTRIHVGRNWLIWSMYRVCGYPALQVCYSLIVYPAWFARAFWFMYFLPFRKNVEQTA